MVAAVLHFEEEAGAGEGRRSAASGRRREGRGDVVEDLAFTRIRERDVDTGNRGEPRIRIVDVATRQDQMRLRVTAPQAMHHRPKLSVRLRGHRTAVDHADVGVLVAVRYRESGPRQPVAELGHLGEIQLASERLDRDVHRCWTRIAAATMRARRARKIRGPRLTVSAPRSCSALRSSSVQPPSGPTARV